jgi:hypothetical protein
VIFPNRQTTTPPLHRLPLSTPDRVPSVHLASARLRSESVLHDQGVLIIVPSALGTPRSTDLLQNLELHQPVKELPSCHEP